MRKLAVVVALMCAVVLAAAAVALEVSGLRAPGVIPSGSVGVARIAVLASEPMSLPGGLIAFTGSGDKFYAEYWQDPDGDGTWAYSTPMGVPGSFTLPRPNAERSGDSLYVRVRFYCATDSVSYFWTDR